MLFNFAQFFRLTWAAMFQAEGTSSQLSPKRWRVLFWWYLLVPVHNLITQVCFGLDTLLYPAFRQQQVKAPIFIIGNFRSGSTLLQRLLARDSDNLTAMKLWEIYVAPSLTQRYFWLWVGRMDARWLGGRLAGQLTKINNRLLGKIQMHSVGLWHEDEDEGVMCQTWDTTFLMFPFAFMAQMPRYWRFDTDIPRKRQDKIMRFYKQVLQRHVWFHGGKRYVAKNPAFSVKIEALRRTFPDAQFIYLVRNPIDTVASKTTFFSYIWHYLGTPAERHPNKDFTLELIGHWYRYPLARLDAMPESQRRILPYEDLVDDLDGTIRDLYTFLGLDVHSEFEKAIRETVARQRDYESENRYSLADMGYTVAFLREHFADIFERFPFGENGRHIDVEPKLESELHLEVNLD
ncbi:MAG: sulfotransferase [Anaerolineae bacterium]|nr:MAG: sulfotransferase [Anaerolineae bacterium]